MVYRVHASDRTAFKRCRREWDLSSRNRRNLEPIPRPSPMDPSVMDPSVMDPSVMDPSAIDLSAVDRGQALRDALAVYYFPGMWEWDRAIVRPLVYQALDRSLRGAAAGEVDEPPRHEALEWGRALLDTYAAWASTVDHFTPIRIDTDFEVNVPDPARPDVNLLTTGGDEVRYCGRVDLLVIDSDDAYWVVQHRLVTEGWADQDALQLDEQTIAWAWAWPKFYLGMRIAGTVYNEIRVDASSLTEPAPPPSGRAHAGHRRMYARGGAIAGERVRTEGTDGFRRTHIRRGDAELSAAGTNLAVEVSAATRADVDTYPSPSPGACARCSYRAPCVILNQGHDASAELSASYRQRPAESFEEGRLGGVTWSMNRGAAPPPNWSRKS